MIGSPYTQPTGHTFLLPFFHGDWNLVALQERLYLSVSLREDAMQLRASGSERLKALVRLAKANFPQVTPEG